MTPVEVAGKPSQFLAKLEINGTQVGSIVMGAQISTIARFFGATWTVDDCELCTRILFEEFKYLKAAEFKYFVNKVLAGYYTSPKNLSPAILAEWLRKFSDEMLKAREDAKERWAPPEKPVPNDVWETHYNAVIEKLTEKVQQQEQESKVNFPTLEQSIEKIKTLGKDTNQME